MESIVRVGKHELRIRANGSTVQYLPFLTAGWLSLEMTNDFCTVFPKYSIYTSKQGRHIVHTATGEVVSRLPDESYERVLDYKHILDSGIVIDMETLETCEEKDWNPPPSMQVTRQKTTVTTLAVTDYYGLTSGLPSLRIAEYPFQYVSFGVVDSFIAFSILIDSPLTFRAIAGEKLTIELKEVLGIFYIFQVRGSGMHTKAAIRSSSED